MYQAALSQIFAFLHAYLYPFVVRRLIHRYYSFVVFGRQQLLELSLLFIVHRQIRLNAVAQEKFLLIANRSFFDLPQCLGTEPGDLFFRYLHECRQGHSQEIVALHIFYTVEARQAYMKILKSDLRKLLLASRKSEK